MGRAATAIAIAAVLAGCDRAHDPSWSQPNADAHSTRAAVSAFDRAQTRRLREQWSFRIPATGGESGAVSATPVVADGAVYLQDLKSNVYALDAADGRPRWEHHFEAQNPGPNGLAVAGGSVYGATDTTVFALSTRTGRMIWSHRILSPVETFVDVAPLVEGSRVYVATVGYNAGTRGKLYALGARTGRILWRVDTIKGPWAHPKLAGGGGAWNPPSVDGNVVYWGTANPIPWGGTRAEPNGAAFPGRALYTDTLLALDARSGRILWYDQVTPHDVRDYDFQLPPLIVGGSIIGAGKAGRVIAWSAATRHRLWATAVGMHRNDQGSLPQRRVPVCPGLLGGVETPMAVADGRVFVPVVDLCVQGSATGYEPLAAVDPMTGRGELVALSTSTGRRLWTRKLGAPDFGCATAGNGVVFTSTLDGTVLGLDARTGSTIWTAQASAGINACPSIGEGKLFVAAGMPVGARRHFELVAYGD